MAFSRGVGEQVIYWRIGEEKGDRGDLWEGGKKLSSFPLPRIPRAPGFCVIFIILCSLFSLINKFLVLTVFDILKNLL